MGIFDNCIFACDIDGTLMDNGYINPRNIEKIDFFVKEGGRFALASGRGLSAIELSLSDYIDLSYCIACNGSIVYDFKKSEILFQDFIPYNDYKIVEKVLEIEGNAGAEIYCGASIYTLNLTDSLKIHQDYERFNAPLLTLEEAKKLKWNKVIYTFTKEEQRENIKNNIKNLDTNSNFVDTCALVDNVFYPYYEQLPLNATKLTALKKLQELLGLENGITVAMGDYYNDLEMLKGADISAVPDGSPNDVSQYADFVGGTCKNGAVADFIDYLTSKFSGTTATL